MTGRRDELQLPSLPPSTTEAEKAVERELLADQLLWMSNALEHADETDRITLKLRIEEIQRRLAEL